MYVPICCWEACKIGFPFYIFCSRCICFVGTTGTLALAGVHMIGARTADLIAEAVVAMEFKASAEDISRMSHAHPTFAEAIKEAALAATDNRALHI